MDKRFENIMEDDSKNVVVATAKPATSLPFFSFGLSGDAFSKINSLVTAKQIPQSPSSQSQSQFAFGLTATVPLTTNIQSTTKGLGTSSQQERQAEKEQRRRQFKSGSIQSIRESKSLEIRKQEREQALTKKRKKRAESASITKPNAATNGATATATTSSIDLKTEDSKIIQTLKERYKATNDWKVMIEIHQALLDSIESIGFATFHKVLMSQHMDLLQWIWKRIEVVITQWKKLPPVAKLPSTHETIEFVTTGLDFLVDGAWNSTGLNHTTSGANDVTQWMSGLPLQQGLVGLWSLAWLPQHSELFLEVLRFTQSVFSFPAAHFSRRQWGLHQVWKSWLVNPTTQKPLDLGSQVLRHVLAVMAVWLEGVHLYDVIVEPSSTAAILPITIPKPTNLVESFALSAHVGSNLPPTCDTKTNSVEDEQDDQDDKDDVNELDITDLLSPTIWKQLVVVVSHYLNDFVNQLPKEGAALLSKESDIQQSEEETPLQWDPWIRPGIPTSDASLYLDSVMSHLMRVLRICCLVQKPIHQVALLQSNLPTCVLTIMTSYESNDVILDAQTCWIEFLNFSPAIAWISHANALPLRRKLVQGIQTAFLSFAHDSRQFANLCNKQEYREFWGPIQRNWCTLTRTIFQLFPPTLSTQQQSCVSLQQPALLQQPQANKLPTSFSSCSTWYAQWRPLVPLWLQTIVMTKDMNYRMALLEMVEPIYVWLVPDHTKLLEMVLNTLFQLAASSSDTVDVDVVLAALNLLSTHMSASKRQMSKLEHYQEWLRRDAIQPLVESLEDMSTQPRFLQGYVTELLDMVMNEFDEAKRNDADN